MQSLRLAHYTADSQSAERRKGEDRRPEGKALAPKSAQGRRPATTPLVFLIYTLTQERKSLALLTIHYGDMDGVIYNTSIFFNNVYSAK